VELLAAILCVRSGADATGALVCVAFDGFRTAPRDVGDVAALAVVLAVPLTAALLVLLTAGVLTAGVLTGGVLTAGLLVVPFVTVLRADATLLTADEALAARALPAVFFAAVVLAAVVLAVPLKDVAALGAAPSFFAVIAFFTAILSPSKVAPDRPHKSRQVA